MQTIALITMNRPEKKNERKSTLIVAPAALLDQVGPHPSHFTGVTSDLCLFLHSYLVFDPLFTPLQWRQEIIDRTETNFFKIRVHHGKEKLKSTAEVKKYDVRIL